MKIVFKDLSIHLWDDVVKFFEVKGSDSGCWCMNHRMNPDKVATGNQAKTLLKDSIEQGKVNGFLIYDSTEVIGWCSIDRIKTLIGHDCFDKSKIYKETEWAMHCMCLSSEYREKSVEKLIVDQALNFIQGKNGSRLEVYPEPDSTPGREFKTFNDFGGYESDYFEKGFSSIESVDKRYSTLEKFF